MLLSGVCVFVFVRVCAVCASVSCYVSVCVLFGMYCVMLYGLCLVCCVCLCMFRLMCLCAVSVGYCLMLYGVLCLCVIVVCIGAFVHVFVMCCL